MVAKKLSRQYCGIELDEHYALLAEKRLLLADSHREIQGYRDGLFWERNTSVTTTRKLQDQGETTPPALR